ncbi:MAG: Asp23/Gls24 family envelope stress response protein [Oscillospiraceae bacterium]|nr:Asp23/Gls24 family envelope stress response protein [Oscillospiraceae bacterium]
MAEIKETVVKLDDNGTLHIAEDVIASIVSLAALEVEGVSALTGTASGSDVGGKKSRVRGIRLAIDGENINVDISLLVKYGHPVVAVSAKVQERVSSALSTMTGLAPGHINIHVAGVAFEKK